MTFEIRIDWRDVSDLRSPEGCVTVIPFTGRVRSPLFTGEIRPGAADVQTEKPGEARVLTAKYLFHGKDADGADCSLYVENIGTAEQGPGPIRAVPTFLTDSRTLGAYLMGRRFRSEVHGWEGGVKILVFEAGEELN